MRTQKSQTVEQGWNSGVQRLILLSGETEVPNLQRFMLLG